MNKPITSTKVESVIKSLPTNWFRTRWPQRQILSFREALTYLSPSWIIVLWWKGLHNSWKLWNLISRATQDGRVIVESSDKTWSAGGGNGKPLQYSCCENPMNCIKRQKIVTPKDEPSMLEGVQYAPGGERRTITNSSRKNEAACWEGTFSLYSKWHYTLETLTEKAPSHGNLLQSQPEEVSIPAHISQVDTHCLGCWSPWESY